MTNFSFMFRRNLQSFYYPWILLTALTGFGIGYIHHLFFFPLHFHADAAAIHVLAKASANELSLLPKDFYYINQIIFLRSSLFIALVALFNSNGITAFEIGSAISIGFWATILFIFLNIYLKSKKTSFLFTILMLIPLGPSDINYMLGQQSHLANAILAFGTLCASQRYFTEMKTSYLLIAGSCLFIMTVEAPIRGMLVITPIVISIFIVSNFKDALHVGKYFLTFFLFAFSLNRIILFYRPIVLDYFNTLTFKSSTEFIANYLRTIEELISELSSMDLIAGEPLSLFSFIIYLFSILLIVAYGYNIADAIGILISKLKAKIEPTQIEMYLKAETDNKDGFEFLLLASGTGFLIGSFAVAGLNPDSYRHYLWVIFSFKFLIFLKTYIYFCRRSSIRLTGLILTSLILVLSTWAVDLRKYGTSLLNEVEKQNSSDAIQDIKRLSTDLKINHIYGEDYYRMMPLNVRIDNVSAQTLILLNGEIYPYAWLARPSWSCVEHDVLYYLKSGKVDSAIKTALKQKYGRELLSEKAYSIWIGPPIWLQSDSQNCKS